MTATGPGRGSAPSTFSNFVPRSEFDGASRNASITWWINARCALPVRRPMRQMCLCDGGRHAPWAASACLGPTLAADLPAIDDPGGYGRIGTTTMCELLDRNPKGGLAIPSPSLRRLFRMPYSPIIIRGIRMRAVRLFGTFWQVLSMSQHLFGNRVGSMGTSIAVILPQWKWTTRSGSTRPLHRGVDGVWMQKTPWSVFFI